MGTTVFATVSTPGPKGDTGPPGYSPQFIVFGGPPTAGVGNNGDMYINSFTGDVFGPKTNNTWAFATNIKGQAGVQGPPGPTGYAPQYIVAAGPPTAGVGNNGDMYINSSTADVFGPKTAGTWGSVQCNIRGIAGPPGVSYAPQGAWSSTATYAQGDEVTDVNIIYIALQSTNLNHVPASSPAWWMPIASSGSQTPWLTNIDGANLELHNASKISIGTPTPLAPLTIVGTQLPLALFAATSAGSPGIELRDGAATPNRWWLTVGQFSHTDGVFLIFDATRSLTRMMIDVDGNVGIGGVNRALGNLHVEGNPQTNVTFGPGNAGTMDFYANSAISQVGYADFSINAYNAPSGTLGQNGTWTPRDPAYEVWIAGFAATENATGNFTITHSVPGTFTPVDFLTILSNGNIGIHNPSPNYPLEVSGDLGCKGMYHGYIGGNGSPALYVPEGLVPPSQPNQSVVFAWDGSIHAFYIYYRDSSGVLRKTSFTLS